MASVTLAESAKLAQNQLVAGVIENTITVNQMFEVIPFDGITGNALAYNRENALGDVQMGTVDTDITAKAAATFTQVTSSLTTIIGDAEVNSLVKATRSSDGNDQVAVQIGSKAKSVGRQYQNLFINGTGSSNEFSGLLTLCAAGQTLTAGANGASLTLEMMDELLDKVLDKDGQVDWITMHSGLRRKYHSLLRAGGGNNAEDFYTLPSGKQVIAYRGTPIFRNDWIPTTQTQGSSSVCTTMLAGNWDDGSRTVGIAGLTAEQDAGISVTPGGIMEGKDNEFWRVRFHCGLAVFSEKGLAMTKGLLLT